MSFEIIGAIEYKNKTHMEKMVRELSYKIGPIDGIYNYSKDYHEFIRLLCLRHPNNQENLSKFKDFQLNYGSMNKCAIELKII